ncbi:MAG: NAD(P)-dependent alcohol dehydrogenase [Thermoplasmata archaeon]|nr:NAD(P)-dependent alcohol dehydrogenase [Thermoplasmata archaeon]
MKAWILDRYGPPEGLTLRDVPFPAFRDDHEVLVRVYGASVNPADRHQLNPPLIFRRRQGFLRPKVGRPGLDLAGRVEVVGTGVKELRVGDEVFGVGRGAFGEYAIADETEVALKPTRLTFEQAAAVPIAATTALQGLRDKAQVRPGHRVLINGASGGVGTFAVQIAKSLGSEVSCVCSPRNVELVRSLGVDRIFDYSREDFTKSGQRYDVIFDTQLNHSLAAYRGVLDPHGLLLIVGAGPGTVSRLLLRLIKTTLGARIVGPRTKFFVAKVNKGDLVVLKELLDTGILIPVIDRRYPLNQVPDALRYLIEGHARGKVVINVEQDSHVTAGSETPKPTVRTIS